MLASCSSIWDSANAQLSPCAVQYASAIPCIIIIFIAISYALGSYLTKWWPEWTRPFISEQLPECICLPQESKKPGIGWLLALFTLSSVGFTAEMIQLMLPGSNLLAAGFLISWAAAALIIVVTRPRTSPTSMLMFFLVLATVRLLSGAGDEPFSAVKTIVPFVTASAAITASVIILFMRLRDPSLPPLNIATVGQEPTKNLRSPEDNLRLWQFLSVSWMEPLLSKGKKGQLSEDDVWSLGHEFEHRGLHQKFRLVRGSVIRRLLKANGADIFTVVMIAIVQMFCGFSIPVLLQQILRSMGDQSTSRRVPMIYAIMALVLRLLAAQVQVLNLWYGRRCYERCRGEMIMMIYEKALSRKNSFGEVDESRARCGDETAGRNDEISHKDEGNFRKLTRICRVAPWKQNSGSNQKKESASIGKIFNLLRGDVYEVAQRFWEVDSLVDKPLGLIIAMVLIWKLIGPSCLLGILATLTAQVVNAAIIRMFIRAEKIRRLATDARLQVSSQFVEAIRHLRWYGWQNHWLHRLMSERQTELNLRIITSLWSALIALVNTFSSGIFPVLALYAYTLLAGNTLRVDIIFPALQLFTMLETRLRDIPALVTVFINASIAVERIEGFMSEPNKESRTIESSLDAYPIQLESCYFAWPGRLSLVLSDISLSIPTGLTVVFGKVGGGKTALLQALLGELDQLGGIRRIPNEKIGFCGQTPWLQSMTIRDNILFYTPYNEQRYKETLEVCELVPDLANFSLGDLSPVGENGVGLSGGQKVRIALARAVYSSARILLLDDPLSALDFNTAENVVRKCLLGQLMRGRTIVLVTHRITLVQHIATQLIEIEAGRVVRCSKNTTSATGSSEEEQIQRRTRDTDHGGLVLSDDHADASPSKFIEEEHRAEWGVQASVYWRYVQAGKYKWWAALVAILAVYRMAAVGESWFLKEWGEAYGEIHSLLGPFPAKAAFTLETAPDSLARVVNASGAYFKWADPFKDLPSPVEDVRPWLFVFFGIATSQSMILFAGQVLMLVIVYCASKTLFRKAMERVSRATFTFFDVTPTGRLMNRLTSDFGVVDGNISMQLQGIAWNMITWVFSILVIAITTPTFLGFTLVLTATFIITFRRFLPTSQSLRRLEMVSLTPLLSNFGELLHGLTTVRAFHAESLFQDRVIAVLDNCQGMDHFYWSLQAWLVYRFEVLSALSTFCLTALALYTNVSPGLAAFVLVAASSFVDSTHSLCKQYGQLQMDFVSVERVDELLHIDQEAPGSLEPPASWPTFGSDISFINVTIRYRPYLDPALSNISLRIPGGSTTVIMGRTGSGKSSLVTSILSVIRPESGCIMIDNVDVAKVNVQALRTRVTFVAQDPVFFPGSIRLNLDPTGDYSDEECADALARVCRRQSWTLNTRVDAGGRNFSQGQRQLIGLTRSVLRRSSIVILDEATASIDHETLLEIQQILRDEMRESTVITIAHRLEAIKDADYYIILDRGTVSEQGYVRDRAM